MDALGKQDLILGIQRMIQDLATKSLTMWMDIGLLWIKIWADWEFMTNNKMILERHKQLREAFVEAEQTLHDLISDLYDLAQDREVKTE